MKGLARNVSNAFNEYKSTIHIKKRDIIAASIATSKRASANDITVEPEIVNNSDKQEEADRQNISCLAEIGVKERIAEGITKIVGRDITDPIIRTTDNSDFKFLDQYLLHQLFTAILESTERPESTNIWRHLVNIVGTIFN